jgi:ribosome biogenesis GTPase
VGDWVLAERNPFGQWWVHARAAPLNQLARRLHDGRDKVARVVIVSNVDTALLVMGLDHDFNTRRLERYLALVRMAGVSGVVVLTKKDLVRRCFAAPAAGAGHAAADTLAVAVDALGTEPLRRCSPGCRPGRRWCCWAPAARARAR